MDDCALMTREATRPRRLLRQRCTSMMVVLVRVPMGSLDDLDGAARSHASPTAVDRR